MHQRKLNFCVLSETVDKNLRKAIMKPSQLKNKANRTKKA